MAPSHSILVVDDSRENINILLTLLEDYDLLAAKDGKHALDMVIRHPVDLVLLDIMMPDMDGYEVCRRLKANDKTRDIPVLFITARVDEESIEKAFEVGGVDYVTKPFKPGELRARVRTQLQLRDTLLALKYAATHDPMTGLYNRRKFFEEGLKMLKEKQQLYAVMIDIDHFKSVNDRFGHAFGDEVIRHITTLIDEWRSPNQVFARLGGEEFVLLGYDGKPEEIQQAMDAIRRRIRESSVSHEEGAIHVSISMGIAFQRPEDTLDSLLNRADEQLYAAKNQGRNRVCFRV